MIATWNSGTSTASDTTWDGTSTSTWPSFNSYNAYDDWQQQQRELAKILLYEQSRAWTKAPAVISPHCPFTFRNILWHHHISPRPWAGRNFHR